MDNDKKDSGFGRIKDQMISYLEKSPIKNKL